MKIHAWLILTALAGLNARAGEPVRFNQDIRPILSKKCILCHGPDADKGRKANLRLDQPDGPEGAYRIEDGLQAIKPGDLENSEAWKRILSDDPEEIMPPPEDESHVKPLTSEEREHLKQWILQGAEYEEFWSFVPPREPAIPTTRNTTWSKQPIDQFTLAKIEEAGFEPSPPADKRTLIRRASLDLTGLPPTLEEIDAFLADNSESAYETLVDRLIDSPRYGEHMAKYWLDLVRFADTNGVHHDHFRDMSPYRDWVIRSFNNNLRYDDFVKHQIAGDLYPEPTTDQLVGSGFNRLHLIIDVGTALPEESHFKNVVDRVSAVGTAFMGLTLQCAVCHDHKYDPITQKDFYSMYAFFNNFDGEPETGRRGGPDFKRGLQPPYITFPTPDQKRNLKLREEELAQLKRELTTLKAEAAEDEAAIKAKTEEIKKAQNARDKVHESIQGAMVMKERDEVRPTHIMIRGAYDSPGELVERNTPSFLPPLEKQSTKTRMDLAEWLVDQENPLTARVAVNRFWQQFFGTGIVKTSEDFGAQGQWPSHPELLDHLTIQFIESGWDIKALVKSIVLTKTYRQSSSAPPERFTNDPENRLLTRGSRYRLDSEVIRDQVLAVSGLLSERKYGQSVKPPQPSDLWKLVTMPSSYPREYVADTGENIYRRSVYTFWKRGLAPPQMTIFDAPSRESCIARRERTNTPLQALVLMNEPQFFSAARELASKTLTDQSLGDSERIALIYESISSHEPSESTIADLQQALEDFRAIYRDDPTASAEISGKDLPSEQQRELAAWTMIVHSFLNLDATKTRE